MTPSTSHPMAGPLKAFLAAFLSLVVISVLYGATGFHEKGASGWGYLWPNYPAFDFVDYTLQFPYLHTPVFFTLPVFPWSYPAPAIFVLYPFYKLAAYTNRVVGFCVFAAIVGLLDLLTFYRFRTAFRESGLGSGAATVLSGSVLLLGWPTFFSLQRGNIESLMWVGVALFVFLYMSGRTMYAAILLGVVGSVKLSPFCSLDSS